MPGRAFSMKGATVGLALAVVWTWVRWQSGGSASVVETLAWLLALPAISAFFAMNFTGASTYTSLSGVRREMRYAVPAEVGAAALGLCLWVVGRFV